MGSAEGSREDVQNTNSLSDRIRTTSAVLNRETNDKRTSTKKYKLINSYPFCTLLPFFLSK